MVGDLGFRICAHRLGPLGPVRLVEIQNDPQGNHSILLIVIVEQVHAKLEEVRRKGPQDLGCRDAVENLKQHWF
jgi:hypothetical protein